jgi:hypothetical protein
MSFWKRLFRKAPRPAPDLAKTAPLDVGLIGQAPPVRGVRRMVLGSAQSTGIERTHNEDTLFYMIGRADGQEPLPEFGLFVVADGMGGHRSGEVASAISVRTVARKITAETIVHLFDVEPLPETASLFFGESVSEEQGELHDRGPPLAGGDSFSPSSHCPRPDR